MGNFVLSDPIRGTGARVSDTQRLASESLIQTEQDEAAVKGWKFNINTGDITLTNATKTSVLYLKNIGDYDIVINNLIYNLGNTTSGTGDILIQVLRNPAAGDIITNANVVETGPTVAANENFASTNLLEVNAYKGATGETALSGSDGIVLSTRSKDPSGRIFLGSLDLVLPKGTALGIDYTPPASNTSQTCQFIAAVHVRNPDFVDINI